MLVLYLTNRYIRAVEGQWNKKGIRIKRICSAAIQKNCFVNGTIQKEEVFVNQLREFWRANDLPGRGVNLVIAGNQFTTKILEAPVQSVHKTIEYVGREFAEVERLTDPVHGYFVLHGQDKTGKKLQSLFAMAVQREYLQKFQQLFGSFGVTIRTVEPVAGGALKLIDAEPGMRTETAILQFVDDSSIINILLVEGNVAYMNRNRLNADQSTPAYPVEVARAVSNLLQFAHAQEIQAEIRKVYVSGLGADDLEIYRESIAQINSSMEEKELNLRMEPDMPQELRGQLQLPGMLLAVGALRAADPGTNVIRWVSRNPQQEEKRRDSRRIILLLSLLALVLGGSALSLGVQYFSLKSQLTEAKNYNSSESVQQICEQYDTLLEQIAALGRLRTSIDNLEAQIAGYPAADGTAEAAVDACAEGLVTAQVVSYRSQTGELSITASAAKVSYISEFVARLEQEALFSDVNYTGYTQSGEDTWKVSLSCVLAQPLEEESETEEDGTGAQS